MDNFHIDVRAVGEDAFKLALKIAFGHHSKATHFQCSKTKLIFYWAEVEGEKAVTPLPYEMDVEKATRFAWDWLASATYGQEPDHDGDNGKGFKVYNDKDWDHVDGDWAGICAIVPCWAMYGK